MDLVYKAMKAWDLEVSPEGYLIHAPTGQQLRAKWIPLEKHEEALVDLKAFHGMDAEKELASVLLHELITVLLGTGEKEENDRHE
jgi:hypothetical protein